MTDFYIVNISHTKRSDQYITVWRPDCKGYAWPLAWAGKYTQAEVRAHLDYYNSGDNVAVPCHVLDAVAVKPLPKTVDGDTGPVVMSTADNWKLILRNVIAPATKRPKPLYRTERKVAPETVAEPA